MSCRMVLDAFLSLSIRLPIARNCERVASFDCTRCLTCRSPSVFVSDGSCQPPPALTGTLTNFQTTQQAMCNTQVFAAKTDFGLRKFGRIRNETCTVQHTVR